MKLTAAILTLACASSVFGAKIVIVKPRARVVVVVRPRYDAANFAGSVIGSAIAQWMINRQNRATYGNCDPLFNSNCQAPAPVAAPVQQTGPGTVLLPGQCPGLLACTE